MRLRILSDLHIEFYPFTVPPMPGDAESILILAGDVGVIRAMNPLQDFLREVSSRFRAVVYVLGNHEFYGNVWPLALASLRAWKLPNNLHILEKESVVIDDVGFIGATLWTDYDRGNPVGMIRAKTHINDYRSISFAQSRKASQMRGLVPEDLLQEHKETKVWLSRALQEMRKKADKIVMVTHHGISHQSIGEQHRASNINGAFVSDLESFLDVAPPDIAIHGHVHNSCNYRLENSVVTRVIVNPRGYARNSGAQENKEFNPYLCVEI